MNGLQADRAGRALPLSPPARRADLIVAVMGLLTPSVGAAPSPRQSASPAIGGIFASEIAPRPWLDLEINYQLSHLTESFAVQPAVQPGGQPLASFGSYVKEASAEYVLARRSSPTGAGQWRPFLGLGGGLLQFSAPAPYSGQMRGVYLVDPGVEIPTRNDRLALRVDLRALIYRAPNFGASALANDAWTTTVQPTFGLVWHF